MQSEKNSCLNWWKNNSQLDVSYHVERWMPCLFLIQILGKWEEYLELYDAWFSCSGWPTRHNVTVRMIYGSISVLWCLQPSTQILKQPKKKSSTAMFGCLYKGWMGWMLANVASVSVADDDDVLIPNELVLQDFLLLYILSNELLSKK